MEDSKKAEPTPEWKHNQELSFKGMRELFGTIKDKMEDVLAAKKRELAQLQGAKDSLTRK
jgi:hypothetical protein